MFARGITVALITIAVISVQAGERGAERHDKPALIQLTSTAFVNGKPIPQKYTCDSSNVSPPLTWSDTPLNARSWALICEDPDAPRGTFTHWVVYGIPGKATELAEGIPANDTVSQGAPTTGTPPQVARQGLNDMKKVGYTGPCPPAGKPHRYIFHLYALDVDLPLPPRATKQQVLSAVKGHVIGEGTLMGTYQRKQ